MTEGPISDRNDSDNFDDGLTEQYDRLLRDIEEGLDIEAGLRAILLSGKYDAMAKDLDSILDVESGLAAILSDSPHFFASRMPSTDEVLGLNQELQLLSWMDRLRLNASCREPLLRAMVGVHRLADGFDSLLRREGLLADGVERRRVISEVSSYELLQAVERLNDGLDDNVFDAFREAVELTEQRANIEFDLGVAWINNTHEVLWRSGRKIISRLGCLRSLAGGRQNVSHWFDEVKHHCRYLRAQLYDYSRDLQFLAEILTDFTHADFTEANLHDVELDGVRWSDDTLWPDSWRDHVSQRSFVASPGVFEVSILRAAGRNSNGHYRRLNVSTFSPTMIRPSVGLWG
ncbi:hypothetical protein ACWDSJ_13980 [Nocardia sp. NPDC003482]